MNNYIECQVCGSCINVDTNSELIWCACGAIGVDGNKDYVRVLGQRENWKFHKDGKICEH